MYHLRLLFWKIFKTNGPKWGKYSIVYFPNVKKFFTVYVTSIRHHEFTGIFMKSSDYAKSKVAEEYNQIENDIIFDTATFTPIYRK